MLCGLALYLRLKRRYLGDIGDRPAAPAPAKRRWPRPLTPDQRDRLIALLVIMVFTFPFGWPSNRRRRR